MEEEMKPPVESLYCFRLRKYPNKSTGSQTRLQTSSDCNLRPTLPIMLIFYAVFDAQGIVTNVRLYYRVLFAAEFIIEPQVAVPGIAPMPR